MGDRAQVVVGMGTPESRVFLYSHWGGEDLKAVLATALDRGRNRWDDPHYLARIVFSEIVRDDISGETGFGISTGAQLDIEHPIQEVDCSTGTVRTWNKEFEEVLSEVPILEFVEKTMRLVSPLITKGGK